MILSVLSYIILFLLTLAQKGSVMQNPVMLIILVLHFHIPPMYRICLCQGPNLGDQQIGKNLDVPAYVQSFTYFNHIYGARDSSLHRRVWPHHLKTLASPSEESGLTI
jgi:hypothetical protein